MSVLRPRNRLVNFRLSEDEFELLRDSCGLFGARSISDFARTSVLERLSHGIAAGEGAGTPGNYPGTVPNPVGRLGNKVAELEIRVGQILNLLQATGESGDAPESMTESMELGVSSAGIAESLEMHEGY